MNTNNWNKTIDKVVPYIDWASINRKYRTSWHSGRHSNIAMELHLILEGSCRVELNDSVLDVKAGQALIILPNTFHACNEITEPFLRFTLSFVLQDPTPMYGHAENGANHILFNIDDRMRAMCYGILEEYDRNSRHLRNEMLSAMFSEFFIHLMRTIEPREEKEEVTANHRETIQIIDQYFSSFNMAGGHTRKGLSELLNCSERQLNRILQDLCGMSFVEKRLRSRMDYAKFLLRNTDLKIPEISSMVGYSNEASFYKVFKENFDVTPQIFRETYSKR